MSSVTYGVSWLSAPSIGEGGLAQRPAPEFPALPTWPDGRPPGNVAEQQVSQSA